MNIPCRTRKHSEGRNITDTFNIYRPLLVTLMVFRRKGLSEIKEESFRDLALEKDIDPHIFGRVQPIIEKRFVTAIMPKVFSDWDHDDPQSLMELQLPHFQKERMKAKNRSKKIVEQIQKKNRTLSHIDTFFIFVTGTKKKMWHESHIDMSLIMKQGIRDRQLTEIATKPAMMKLNEGLSLTNTPTVRASLLQYNDLPTALYALGLSQHKREEQFPQMFLLDIDLDRADEEKNGSPSLQGGFGRVGADAPVEAPFDLEAYEDTAQSSIINISRFLSNFTILRRIIRKEFEEDESQSKQIRMQIHELQSEINRLFQASMKKQKNDSKLVNKDEEELLNKASMFFSTVSELQQSISNGIFQHHEFSRKINEERGVMGIENTPFILGQMNLSPVFEPHTQFSERVKFQFENLQKDVESSQSSLRNTIDVLRTFLESKQRIASEKQNRSLGLLTITLAGMGLADAVGNFVIFYFQSGDWFRAVLGSGITLIILVPLLATLLIISLRKK